MHVVSSLRNGPLDFNYDPVAEKKNNLLSYSLYTSCHIYTVFVVWGRRREREREELEQYKGEGLNLGVNDWVN